MIVLRKLNQYFPKNKSTGENLEKALTKLITSAADKNDLFVMATRYKDILAQKISELPDELPAVFFKIKANI